MKPNTTIIAAIAVLLGGIGVFALLREDDSEKPGDSSADNLAGAKIKTDSSNSSDLKPTKTVVRESREDETTALVDKYGASRTNLSRQVVNNVTSLLDDVLEMGDMMTSGEGGAFGNRGDWVIRGLLNGTNVELDEAQKESVAELYKAFQKRELEKTRTAVETLKEKPATLMNLMLASDARSRDEIGEDDYKALQESSAADLEGILNPLDRNNFRGGQPMDDPEFKSGFEAILSEEQSSNFSTAIAEREASGKEERKQTSITEMPVMDLESLDQSISSAKQITSGFKNMMQGMGNIQELEKKRKDDESDQ